MQENENEQTKTGSWPEIRSIGEDIAEDIDAEKDQKASDDSEEKDK